MKVYHSLEDVHHINRPILTTGTFDGVHLGHRKIIESLKSTAAREQGESVLLTFHPHPRMVIFPDDNDLKLLNTQEEKIRLLEKCGIDHLIIHPFTKEFSRLSALEFIRDILVNKIGVRKMVIGYDHQFGKNREGNLEHLEELARLFDFEVEEIPAQDVDQVNVSSTKIRKALAEGDIETANRYLGYRYELTGTVVAGRQLGRQLDYPTANIRVTCKNKLIPQHGVYTVNVVSNGKRYGGMMNIGLRPTVEEAAAETSIEVHLFDFNEDIYGTEITVEFIRRLRDEVKFPSLDALKHQMHADKQRSLDILGKEK